MHTDTRHTDTAQAPCVQAFVHGVGYDFLPFNSLVSAIHDKPLPKVCMALGDACGTDTARLYHGQTNTTKPPDTTT
jgi:hypothetical protein